MDNIFVDVLLSELHHFILLFGGIIIYVIGHFSGKLTGKSINHLTLMIVCLLALDFAADEIRGAMSEKTSQQPPIKEIEREINNRYAKDLYKELSIKKEQIDSCKIVTKDINETAIELVRAMDTTEDSLVAVNCYIEGWNKPPLSTYYSANKRAISRGVDIKRIFLLRENVLNNFQRLQNAMGLMDRQKDDNVRVFYAMENDLKNEGYYQKLTFMGYGLYDSNLLLSDLAPDSEHSVPKSVIFSWSLDEIKEKSPFADLKKSCYIHEYDEYGKEYLLENLENLRSTE